MKNILVALLSLVCAVANAQFSPGQVLTASQLNNQFALYVPIAGGTLTGPLTVPSLSVTGSPISLASGGTGATTALSATSNLQYEQSFTGAVPRSLQSKLAETVSILDANAKEDGVTDDTSAILAIATNTTGPIYFPPGTTACTTAVLAYNQRFVGPGLLKIGPDTLPAGREAISSFQMSVPANFTNPAAALAFLANRSFAYGVIATIQIADGTYTWPQTNASHPQGSAINIIGDTATPANVVVNYDASNSQYAFEATDNRTFGLIDGMTIQSNAWLSHGNWNMTINPLGAAIGAWDGGYIHVGAHMLVTKSYYGIRSINGGKILADAGGQVSECGDVGYHAFGGQMWADGTTAYNCADSGSTGPVGTGYLSENGGSLHAELSTSYGNLQHGYGAYNGALWATSTISYNNTHNGYFAYQGGRIVANTGPGEQTTQAYGNGQYGAYALGGGSLIFYQGGSTHNNTFDGASADGGTIDMTSASTTNNTGAGQSAVHNGIIYGAPTSTGNTNADYASSGGILNGVSSSAQLTGVTFTGAVALGYSTPTLTLNDTSGTNYAQINLNASGVTGWDVGANSSGGNFYIGRFTSGTYTDSPLLISRSTGVVSIPDGLTLKGTTVLPNLSGTTASIGGSALAAGACSSGTAAVTNSTTSMAVVATPATYPGDGIFWHGYVSSAGTVTVKVCASVAATPTASAYNVRVLQ